MVAIGVGASESILDYLQGPKGNPVDEWEGQMTGNDKYIQVQLKIDLHEMSLRIVCGFDTTT